MVCTSVLKGITGGLFALKKRLWVVHVITLLKLSKFLSDASSVIDLVCTSISCPTVCCLLSCLRASVIIRVGVSVFFGFNTDLTMSPKNGNGFLESCSCIMY